MTIQEQVMHQRTAMGLKIVIEREQGDTMALYPKDAATKALWIARYKANGIVILAGEE